MENNKKKKDHILWRVLSTIREFYPVMFPFTIACIIFNAVVSALPTVFMQNIIALVEVSWATGDWDGVKGQILKFVLILVVIYVISLAAGYTYTQLMAIMTQGTLKKLRVEMFGGMQRVPIRYFDTNNHGDIMSHYTNDIDALRQMISQSIPQLLVSIISMTSVLFIMFYYSLWLTLVILVGVAIMVFITGKIGGGSSKYFIRQQKSLGKAEGYIEEMMEGQKVVKVFNHEEEAKQDFDKINEQLFQDAKKANSYANILMPILTNFGNLVYVLVAVVGGLLLAFEVPNVSISGMAISISIVVPFLNMAKQFTGNVTQVSNQVNSIVMGIAGGRRVFELLDEPAAPNEGDVTIVNAYEDKNGNLHETKERTGVWAWKDPQEDGSIKYVRLTGDVRFLNVDFSYVPGKQILRDLSLRAHPGEKIAFVGATGAGKTTITNLINRFYDIEDGKILYDGINIKKIKKDNLRSSMGVILQETNLFTGTVMENIRYGKLDATDIECIAAAELAGANDFITRLPQGYNTMLTANGANLSQGQRQLLSIARAAVADSPVMIMDEATSSIDTHTEAIVQAGMDALMKGRTVFVIAHRLSTVKNSDQIIVLDRGRIVESGNHEELIAKKGQYYQLYTGAFELE